MWYVVPPLQLQYPFDHPKWLLCTKKKTSQLFPQKTLHKMFFLIARERMVKTKIFLFHLHDSLYRCKHGGDQGFRSGQNIVEIKLSGLQFSFVVFFWVCIFFARVRQRTRCGFFHFQPMLGHGHVPGIHQVINGRNTNGITV